MCRSLAFVVALAFTGLTHAVEVKPLLTGTGPAAGGMLNLTSGSDYITIQDIDVTLTSGSRYLDTANGNIGITLQNMVFQDGDASAAGALRFREASQNIKLFQVVIKETRADGQQPGYGGNNAFEFSPDSSYLLLNQVYCLISNHDCLMLDGSWIVLDEVTCDQTEVASDVGDRCMSFRSHGQQDISQANSRVYVQKLDCIGGDNQLGYESESCMKMQHQQWNMRMSTFTSLDDDASTDRYDGDRGVITLGPCCRSDNMQRAPLSADGTIMWSDIEAGNWALRLDTSVAEDLEARGDCCDYDVDYKLDTIEVYASYFPSPLNEPSEDFSIDHHEWEATGDDFIDFRLNSNIFQDASADVELFAEDCGTTCTTDDIANNSGIGSGNTFSGAKTCTGNYPMATANGAGVSSTTLVLNERYRVWPKITTPDAAADVIWAGDSIQIGGGAAVTVIALSDDGLTATLENARSWSDADDIDLVGITANCRGVPSGITPGWTG